MPEQSVGGPLTHTPAAHLSPLVHAMPSSHGPPSLMFVTTHMPVPGSHVAELHAFAIEEQSTPTHSGAASMVGGGASTEEGGPSAEDGPSIVGGAASVIGDAAVPHAPRKTATKMIWLRLMARTSASSRT
jgi:hypothetical protein